MKVTIKDVAKAAGVSPSTVSRALQNNKRISPEVRAKVQKIAQEMDFHPNQMARSLVNRQTRIIGAVFPSDIHMNLGNPFYPSLLQGMGHAASEQRYHLLLITGSEHLSTEEASRQAVDSGYVSGLIHLAAENEPQTEYSVPSVVIGHPVNDWNRCSVDNDNVEAGYIATRFLIDRGHERIMLLGYNPRFMFTVDRREGYEKALNEAGLKTRESWVVSSRPLYVPEDGHELHSLFSAENHPTAVVCMDDAQAIALCQTLSALGLKVPDDVSLISFNNTEASRYHNPPLTTIDVAPYQLGVTATKLMLSMLSGEAESSASITVPIRLIERNSVRNISEGV